MSDMVSHIQQAMHNEKCANHLLTTQEIYIDWSITAAFYAAVHFAEAAFTTKREINADKARESMEKHKYRSNKINEYAPKAYSSYRKLQEASFDVRYLQGKSSNTLRKPYYTQAVAENLVKVELPIIQTELEKAFGTKLR